MSCRQSEFLGNPHTPQCWRRSSSSPSVTGQRGSELALHGGEVELRGTSRPPGWRRRAQLLQKGNTGKQRCLMLIWGVCHYSPLCQAHGPGEMDPGSPPRGRALRCLWSSGLEHKWAWHKDVITPFFAGMLGPNGPWLQTISLLHFLSVELSLPFLYPWPLL